MDQPPPAKSPPNSPSKRTRDDSAQIDDPIAKRTRNLSKGKRTNVAENPSTPDSPTFSPQSPATDDMDVDTAADQKAKPRMPPALPPGFYRRNQPTREEHEFLDEFALQLQAANGTLGTAPKPNKAAVDLTVEAFSAPITTHSSSSSSSSSASNVPGSSSSSTSSSSWTTAPMPSTTQSSSTTTTTTTAGNNSQQPPQPNPPAPSPVPQPPHVQAPATAATPANGGQPQRTLDEMDSELMLKPIDEVERSPQLTDEWLAARQRSAISIVGTLAEKKEEEADPNVLAVRLVKHKPELLNAFEDGLVTIAENAQGQRTITLTIHGRANYAALRAGDASITWAEIQIPANARPTNTNIPVFGLPTKGRYNTENLRRSILAMDRSIDSTKIAHISERPNITTIFCEDFVTASKIANLGYILVPGNTTGTSFLTRFVVLAEAKQRFRKTKIGKFRHAPNARLMKNIINARIADAGLSYITIDLIEIPRNKSKEFLGMVIIFSNKANERFYKAISGDYPGTQGVKVIARDDGGEDGPDAPPPTPN